VPLGGQIVSSARAVLSIDREGWDRELASAQHQIHRFGTTSTQSLERLSSAQLKSRRLMREYTATVSRLGPQAVQSARALERLRLSEEQAARQQSRTGGRRGLFGIGGGRRGAAGELDRTGRSAEHASRLFGHFTNSVAYAGSALIGGFGLTYALESTIKAASSSESAMASLRTQLGHLGISWSANREHIESTIKSQVRLTAFTSGELTASFTNLVTRTGSVNKAFQLNALAADIARRRHWSLEKASQTVIRAMNGNARAATALNLPLVNTAKIQEDAAAKGVKLTNAQLKQAVATQLLGNATRVYGGQAAAFLTTTAGKQALFRAELLESQEIIGRALLPTFNRLISRFSNYIDRLNRTGKLQRDVNRVVSTTGHIVRGVGAGFHTLAAILRPVNRLLGGTRHSAELLGGSLLLLRTRAFAASLGLRGAGASAILARNEIGAAGLAARTSAGRVGLLGSRLTALTAAPWLVTLYFAYEDIKDPKSILRRAKALKDIIGKGGAVEKGLESLPTVGPVIHGLHDLFAATRKPKQPGIAPSTKPGQDVSDRQPGAAARQARDAAARRRRGPVGGRGGIVTQLTPALELRLVQAQATKDQKDDLAALRAQQAALKKDLTDKRLKIADRISLQSQLNDVTGQIAQIEDDAAQKRKQAAAERARKAKQHRAAERSAYRERLSTEREKLENNVKEAGLRTKGLADDRKALRALIAFDRAETHDVRLTVRERQDYRRKMLDAEAQLKKLKTGGLGGLGAKQAQAFIEARGTFFSEFAPNVFGGKSGGRTPGSTSTPSGKTVVVNQNYTYNEIPKNPHHAAQQARLAAAAVLD
jgi:hypothetical protein